MEQDFRSSSRTHQLTRLANRSIRRRIAEHICSSLNEPTFKDYVFIKDIIPHAGFQEAAQIREAYEDYNPGQKTKVFIIASHEQEEQEHLHLYHRCAYNQSNCRCQFLQRFKNRIKKRQPKHIIREYPIKRETIENIINYLNTGQRELLYIQVNRDSLGEMVDRFKSLRIDGQSFRDGSNHHVEDCEIQIENGCRERDSEEQGNSRKIGRIESVIMRGYEHLSGNHHGENSQKVQRIDFIITNLLKFLATPIEAGCHLQQWTENKHLSIFTQSNPEYQLAVNTIQRLTCQLPFEKIHDIHNAKGCFRIYNRRNENIDYYYSIEDSIEYVEQLLMHQYSHEGEMKNFLQRLHSICERQIPKKNSIFIYGRFCDNNHS